MKGALTGGIASYTDWIISKLLNIPELQLLHLWHEATNFCERWQIKHLCIWLKQTKTSHVLFPTPQKETLRKRKAQDPELGRFHLTGTRRPRMTVKHPGMIAVCQAQRPPVQVRAGQKAPRETASKWKHWQKHESIDRIPHVFEISQRRFMQLPDRFEVGLELSTQKIKQAWKNKTKQENDSTGN